MDMATRDRLKSGRGNAILVSDSVYAACRFFKRLQRDGSQGQVRDRHVIPSVGEATSRARRQGKVATEKLRQVRRLPANARGPLRRARGERQSARPGTVREGSQEALRERAGRR